jgi:hypothetical protein
MKMKKYILLIVAFLICFITHAQSAYQSNRLESNADRYNREIEELKLKTEVERLKLKIERLKNGQEGPGSNDNSQQATQSLTKNYYTNNLDVAVYLQDDSDKSYSRCKNSIKAKNFTGRKIDIWVSYLVILYDVDGYEVGRREENYYKKELSDSDYAQDVVNTFLSPISRGLRSNDYSKIVSYKAEKYTIY